MTLSFFSGYRTIKFHYDPEYCQQYFRNVHSKKKKKNNGVRVCSLLKDCIYVLLPEQLGIVARLQAKCFPQLTKDVVSTDNECNFENRMSNTRQINR